MKVALALQTFDVMMSDPVAATLAIKMGDEAGFVIHTEIVAVVEDPDLEYMPDICSRCNREVSRTRPCHKTVGLVRPSTRF
jgi:hypothetical protein